MGNRKAKRKSVRKHSSHRGTEDTEKSRKAGPGAYCPGLGDFAGFLISRRGAEDAEIQNRPLSAALREDFCGVVRSTGVAAATRESDTHRPRGSQFFPRYHEDLMRWEYIVREFSVQDSVRILLLEESSMKWARTDGSW